MRRTASSTKEMRLLHVVVTVVVAVYGAWVQAADIASEGREALLAELRAVPHEILFERYQNNNWELFVMNADGSGKRNLTQTPEIHELYPQSSPDGTKICFLSDVEGDGDTIRSVYYMNADGSGRTLVAEKARQPCWGPDGTKIAFVKQEFTRFNIVDYASKRLYFYDIETGETAEHPNTEIEHLYNLNWSADGRWIVTTVHAGMGYKHGIIAIKVDGMGVYDLKIGGCRPCLSADGRKLTWSPNDHAVNIADIDLASDEPKLSNLRVVDKHETLHLYHPDFSPDGKYITYSVGPGGRTPATGPGTHTQVAEMVGVAGKWNLYLKRANGEGPAVQLTFDESLCNKESEWRPVRGPRENAQ